MDEWFDLPELIDKAQEMIELGFYDEATELLDQYEQMFSSEWEIHFLYSRIFTETNQPEKAISYLHKGLHIDKTNPDCLLGLFYSYAMMNQIKKGGRYLLRAEKYHPDNEMVLATLIWYYTETTNFSRAIDYFEKVKKRGDINPEAYRNGGLAYERIGDYDNAEKCFLAALEINPQYDEVRDLLADHYILREQHQNAIDLYKKAINESPRNIRILSRLVFCYSQADQLEQAMYIAKEMIKFYPNSPVGYVDLAYVHLNKDDYANAISCAETANDIAPIDPEAFRVQGIALSENGEDKKAEEAFLKALELDNENTEIMRDYYHHLRKVKNFEAMEKWVHTVIRIEHPYCVEDYWFLADYYREKELDTKAFNYLHKAYKSMPHEKDLIPPMVDILLDRGHTSFAFSILNNYVEKKGWNEVMDEFARHERLKGRWLQEGIRFLRFRSNRPTDYQKFIFKFFLRKYILISLIFMIVLSYLPLYLSYGIKGVVILTAAIVLFVVIYFTKKFIIQRQQNKKNDDNEPVY